MAAGRSAGRRSPASSGVAGSTLRALNLLRVYGRLPAIPDISTVGASPVS